MHRILLGYDSRDKAFSVRFKAKLMECYKDLGITNYEIEPGRQFCFMDKARIAETDFLILVLSGKSVKSSWIDALKEFAGNREKRNDRVFLISLLIDDDESAQTYVKKNCLDFRSSCNFTDHVMRVAGLLLSTHYPVTASEKMPFCIPVKSYCGEIKYPYHRIGSFQCEEDSIFVSMIYYTQFSVVVDLLVPKSLFEIYNHKVFRWYEYTSGLYDSGMGWIEVYIKRAHKKPKRIEKDCSAIITKHNNELRTLLYFSK